MCCSGQGWAGHPCHGQCPPEHGARRQILTSPAWNLDLQMVFDSKNEFYSIQTLRTWWSSLDLHICLLSRLLLSATVRQKQVCGRLEGTSVVVGALPWPRSNSFQNLCSQRIGRDNRKCPHTTSWPSCETAVRHRDSSKSCVVISVPQVLCNQNKGLWGCVVLQIPACTGSFVCSALPLILQRDGEAVKWLSKGVWKTGWCCVSLFSPTFCRSTVLLQCVHARAAAFLGVSCLSEHHSHWCFWCSLSCRFLSYWCCCAVWMKQWHCLDLQSP